MRSKKKTFFTQVHEHRRLLLLFWFRTNKPQYSEQLNFNFNISDVKLNVLIKRTKFLLHHDSSWSIINLRYSVVAAPLVAMLRVVLNFVIASAFRYLRNRTWGCSSLATELVLSYIFKEWRVNHYYAESQSEMSKPFCVFRWTCYNWTNPKRSLCKTYRNKIIHIHNQCVDKGFHNCSWQPNDIVP